MTASEYYGLGENMRGAGGRDEGLSTQLCDIAPCFPPDGNIRGSFVIGGPFLESNQGWVETQ